MSAPAASSAALDLYGYGLRGNARGRRRSRMRVRLGDGALMSVPLDRWLTPASAVDESVLERARGPVIDLGCGPGRHLHDLACRGVFALGVDISPVAVALARGGGGRAIEASIFDELPGAGRWRTALLLDGNVGIGGRPHRLLERIRSLLEPGGGVLVELDGPGATSRETHARIEIDRWASDWFRWARVGVDGVDAPARAAGMDVHERWQLGGRWFAQLLTR